MTTSHPSASAALDATRAPNRSATKPLPRLVDVPDQRRDSVGDEHACGLRAVHAAADHGVRRGLRSAERIGGQDAGRRRPQCGDRSRVEHGEQSSVFRVRQEYEPGDRGQPARRIPREGRDPLEEGVAVPDRGHRAKVARRVVRHVHLRRHRPRGPCVRLERTAHRVVRLVRRHRALDVCGSKDRDHEGRVGGMPRPYAVLTAEMSFSTDSFASPKSIVVFSSR